MRERLIIDYLQNLSPHVRIEFDVRKSESIKACNKIWTLPRESQPIYKNIVSMDEQYIRYAFLIIGLALFCHVMAYFRHDKWELPDAFESLLWFSVIAYNYFENKFKKLNLTNRFEYLSAEISSAESLLEKYRISMPDGFGDFIEWRENARFDEPIDSDSSVKAQKFHNELDRSILKGMHLWTEDLAKHWH